MKLEIFYFFSEIVSAFYFGADLVSLSLELSFRMMKLTRHSLGENFRVCARICTYIGVFVCVYVHVCVCVNDVVSSRLELSFRMMKLTKAFVRWELPPRSAASQERCHVACVYTYAFECVRICICTHNTHTSAYTYAYVCVIDAMLSFLMFVNIEHFQGVGWQEWDYTHGYCETTHMDILLHTWMLYMYTCVIDSMLPFLIFVNLKTGSRSWPTRRRRSQIWTLSQLWTTRHRIWPAIGLNWSTYRCVATDMHRIACFFFWTHYMCYIYSIHPFTCVDENAPQQTWQALLIHTSICFYVAVKSEYALNTLAPLTARMCVSFALRTHVFASRINHVGMCVCVCAWIRTHIYKYLSTTHAHIT